MTSPYYLLAWMLLFGSGLAGLAGFAGCNHSPTDATERVLSSETHWGAIVHQREKVGHTMEKIEFLDFDGTAYVRTTTSQQMEVKRAGQRLTMRAEHVFLETPQGHLVRYSTKIDQNGAVTRFTGEVTGGGRSLNITTESTAQQKATTDTIKWKSDYGGLFAVYLLTHDSPIGPAEIRDTVALEPTINQPCSIRVEAWDRELVEMLDGSSYKAIKARQVTQIPGQSAVDTTIWVNEDGDIIKMKLPVQQMEMYRCSKEFALSSNKSIEFDLAVDTIIPVNAMPRSGRDHLPELTYRVKLKGGNPAEVFSAETNQVLTEVDPHTAELTVWRVRPDTKLPASLSEADRPGEEALASSSLIEVDHDAVQTLAKEANVTEGDDPWQKAVALERFVHEKIEQKDFSQGFLSAGAVAQQQVGDCTEHSVLLMALLRAHKIPSRGALGLVYVDDYAGKQGFAYHMWTEAWIGDRWIPLDATRGKGGIGIDYIKVTQSDLGGSGAFAAFLPVSQVIGQLDIDVAEK